MLGDRWQKEDSSDKGVPSFYKTGSLVDGKERIAGINSLVAIEYEYKLDGDDGVC